MSVEIVIPTPDYETKIKILHAVDRPIKDIPLNELCAKCGISKQTFYKHFDSKYSIGLWYSRFCAEHFLYQAGRRYTWRDALEMHFAMLCKERAFLSHSSSGTVREQLANEMRRSAIESLSETLTAYKNIELEAEMLFYIQAYCTTLVGATSKWLLDAASTIPVDNYVHWLENCIPRPLYEAINAGL